MCVREREKQETGREGEERERKEKRKRESEREKLKWDAIFSAFIADTVPDGGLTSKKLDRCISYPWHQAIRRRDWWGGVGTVDRQGQNSLGVIYNYSIQPIWTWINPSPSFSYLFPHETAEIKKLNISLDHLWFIKNN